MTQTTRPAAPTRRTSLLCLLAVALVSVAAACGQKGGNDTTPAQQASSTTTTAGNATATTGESSATTRRTASTSPASTGRTSSTGGSTASTSGSSSATSAVPKVSDPQYQSFCQSFADFINELQALPFDTPNAFQDLVEKYQQRFPALVAAAPSEIQADMQTVDTAIQAATQDTFINLDSDPKFKAATEKIDSWMLTNCGFKPS